MVTSRPKFSLGKTGENDLGSAAHPPQCGGRIAAQFPSVADDQIADFVFFQVGPQILGGIEFWSVGRQGGYLQAPLGRGHELLDQLAAMDGRSIPEDQQWNLQVAQERFQEWDDLRTFDRARMDLEIEVPERDSRNERKTLPTEGLLDHRGLTAWRPSAHPVGTCTQAAFVEEDDGASCTRGFFLRFGQPERGQCAIFFSSRSRARRVGR